ncbi:MAG: ABC transporter substrate-binding protein [Bacillota bacterium]
MTNQRKFSIIKLALIILITAVFLISGTNSLQAGDYVDIVDRAGREIEVPLNPKRVVAVGPGALRHLMHFDLEEKIVGVEEGEKGDDLYSDYQLSNPRLRELPPVGPNHGGDIELIVAQEPDLIIHASDPGEAADLQSKTGIPVVYLNFGDLYDNRNQMFEDWELIGQIFEKEDRAEEMINYTEDLITDLSERTKNIVDNEKPKVYTGGMSHRGSHGITSVRVPFPPFRFVNANNVAEEELDFDSVTQTNINREQLLQWNPEIIFIDSSNVHLIKEDVMRHAEYSGLDALQSGNVYTLLPYASYRPQTGNILANAYYIGKILYPEEFSDIEPVEKAEEITEFFLGKPVFEEQNEQYPSFQKVDLLN